MMPLISEFLSQSTHPRHLPQRLPQIRRLNRPLLASHTRGYDGLKLAELSGHAFVIWEVILRDFWGDILRVAHAQSDYEQSRTPGKVFTIAKRSVSF